MVLRLSRVLYADTHSDATMALTGAMVSSWPFIPGCDVSGIIVKVGANAINPLGNAFKEGDEVFGCTKVGDQGYTAWAEYVSNLSSP